MRKLHLLVAILVLSGMVANAQRLVFSYFKDNGQDGLHLAVSEGGYEWMAVNHDRSILKPTVGKEKLMRDPCIVRGTRDGLYHMVWTVGWNERAIGYANSKDLINWSEQKLLPVMEHEPTALNCWAPELYYDKVRDQFMIYWATTIPGRFPETDKSGDDKYNHRLYYITTRDFQHFSETKLLFDPGFNVIDATIVSKDQLHVMIIKDETKTPVQKNLRLAFSPNATGPYKDVTEPFTESWVEGPTVLRGNQGQWILYYDQYTRHRMGGRVTKDFKTWEEITEKLKFPEGTRHGSVLPIPDEDYERLVALGK